MSLDSRTMIISKLSAAAACNALGALRFAITEALSSGISAEEIQEILALAKEIQQQPIDHAAHLTEQVLRDAKKAAATHVHSAHCGCGNHA